MNSIYEHYKNASYIADSTTDTIKDSIDDFVSKVYFNLHTLKNNSFLAKTAFSNRIIDSITITSASTSQPLCDKIHQYLFPRPDSYQALQDILNRWVKDSKVQGNKKEAAQRILMAFTHQCSFINLRGLQLTSLPDCFHLLSKHLTRLDVSENQLKWISPTLKKLPFLKQLHIKNNKGLITPSSIDKIALLLREHPALKILKNDQDELEMVKQELEIWKKDPNVKGEIEEATTRILQAFTKKNSTLNLSNLNLTLLPDCIGYLPHLKELDLRDNRLRTLPESFGSLSNLQALYLENNQLKTLPDSFGALSNLQELDLWKNQLKTLPESFGSLSNLRELDLDNNLLITLPKSFGSLSKLQKLKLRNNRLNTLPESFKFLSNLMTLSLSNNQLSTLPESFKFLSNLITLSLIDNQLRTLPESFGSLSKLQKLDLKDNRLDTLPESFGALSNLMTLSLSNNRLRTLPKSFGSLFHLKELDLRDNRLRTLPESFGSLSNLQTLDLKGNRLSSLPESFGALSNLIRLFLSYNRLNTLPESFGSLFHLKELDLETNSLRFLPTSFNSLSNLQELNLRSNRLSTLPESFGSLRHLQKLWLRGNQLRTLPASFGSLSKLQRLWLEGNQLSTLPTSFGSLSNLRRLYVSNNKLTSLPATIGNCFYLEDITITYNKNLTDIPLSLGNLSGIIFIDCAGTKIPEHIAANIIEMCKANRDKEAIAKLPIQLKLWSDYAEKDPKELDFIIEFEEGEKMAIYEWLTRLAGTADFSKNQKALTKVVYNLLRDTSHKDFKEIFITQIKENNECCGDRAAMGLNELYVSWCLSCPKEDLSRKEMLLLLQGAGKTLALRQILSEKISAYEKANRSPIKESVEIYLYYEHTLKEKLGLLTAINSMLHEEIGSRDWINEKDLTKKVQESYLDQVASFSILDQLLQKDTSATQEIQMLKNDWQNKIEVLLDERPLEDPDSPAVLDWHTRMNQCKAAQEAALKEYKKRWVQTQLQEKSKS